MSNQAATGLGIASLVIAIIAVFIPIAGIYISAFALLLCLIGAFMGDKAFTIAVVAITGIKTFFLSPSFAVLRAGEQEYGFPLITIIVLLALAAPIAAIFIGNAARAKAHADGSAETG